MNNKSNKVTAAIIIIGNEILSGRTRDINLQSWKKGLLIERLMDLIEEYKLIR